MPIPLKTFRVSYQRSVAAVNRIEHVEAEEMQVNDGCVFFRVSGDIVCVVPFSVLVCAGADNISVDDPR